MNLMLKITPVPGAVTVSFAEDFKIDIAFIDSQTGETIADFTGDRSLLISELLGSMPAEAIAQFVDEVAVKMAAIAKGVDA